MARTKLVIKFFSFDFIHLFYCLRWNLIPQKRNTEKYFPQCSGESFDSTAETLRMNAGKGFRDTQTEGEIKCETRLQRTFQKTC